MTLSTPSRPPPRRKLAGVKGDPTSHPARPGGALRAIGAALRPRGHFVFETRQPGRRAWPDWAADTGPVSREVPGSGPVERRREVTAVRLPFVSFRYTYTFLAGGAVITSDSTLRFRSREELESSLATQGYRVLDVLDAPDRPGHEFVFVTQRTT